MMKRRLGASSRRALVVLFAVALLAGAGGEGCGAAVAQVGSGTDAGGDAGSDATGGCTPADCAGLASPALAKMCPDGTSVGATLCTRQASGPCDWGFPECPADAGAMCPALGCAPRCPNGVLTDSAGCGTCQCAPAGDAGGMGTCTSDADCTNGGICGFLESAACSGSGQCFVAPGGARCALAGAIGCGCNGSDVSIDPTCASGLPTGYNPRPVLHAGACTDAGGACVSQRGGPCGGNTSHPCTCASGLACTPGDGGLPFGDVGGSCE
ncbi:MAG: hypothetical protein ACREJ3_05675 [Polyangiaceae bacterium]